MLLLLENFLNKSKTSNILTIKPCERDAIVQSLRAGVKCVSESVQYPMGLETSTDIIESNFSRPNVRSRVFSVSNNLPYFY